MRTAVVASMLASQVAGDAAPAPQLARPSVRMSAEAPSTAEGPSAEEALKNMIASKKAVIEAHNADVAASQLWLESFLRAKEVRKLEDLPGPNPVLDKSLAGDYGWDPLNLADSKTHLLLYREAEVKHGRLAMLAAAGWPASELLHGPISAATGSDSLLAETAGRAPSVLNGGLGQVSGLFWFAALGIAAKIEADSVAIQFEGWQSEGKPWKYTPGDYSFDPANLRGVIADKWADTIPTSDIPADSNDRVELKNNIKANVELAEIMHGRAAMLAVTGFALQEAIYKTPIVDQTPIFFATPVYGLIGATLGGIHDLF